MKSSWISRRSAAALSLVVGGSVATAAPKKTSKSAAKPAKSSAADVTAGKKAFESAGCLGCHRLGKSGGKSAPDLSHEGGKHDAAWIAGKVKDPKALKP